VLLTPDVAVLERAVRERPDVAAAVLEQMRYSVVEGAGEAVSTVARPPERTPVPGDAPVRLDDRAAEQAGGGSGEDAAERVGGDRHRDRR
jgi:hypothetical protein